MMGQIEKLTNRLRSLTDAFSRFPLTAILLIAVVVLNAININREDSYFTKYLISLSIGAIIGAVVQVVYERFFSNVTARILLMGITVLLTIGYYLIIMSVPKLSMEMGIRTIVAMFAFFIAFIWVPSLKNKLSFNESFMVAFKAFFITIFFSGVIFAGISIIFAAINQLLFYVNDKIYPHTANIVFILFAPMFFLSLIPKYIGEQDKNKEQERIREQENQINKLSNCPKYLEILISYIIIPLTAVFTIILLLYIILNIRVKFWTNNLLEPMIVTYSITVILVYILASMLTNRFAIVFRKVFPKVLVPIVLFQTIASILKIGDLGITHNRYYVILFGIFATAAGILFSTVSVKKNGIIAVLLIILSLISIIPPIDAFTISRINQINRLENVLVKNNMLKDNTIKPNPSISQEEKQIIISSVNYLNMMEYIDDVNWLPAKFDYYADFNKTFGFYQYEQNEYKNEYVNLNLPQNTPFDIAGYNFFVFTSISQPGERSFVEEIGKIKKAGINYTLSKSVSINQSNLILTNENKEEIMSFPMKDILDKYRSYYSTKGLITADEATFSSENNWASITVIVQNLNMNNSDTQQYYEVDMYVFVKIK